MEAKPKMESGPLKRQPLQQRWGPHLEVAQASIADGLPQNSSLRIHLVDRKNDREDLGSLFLLLEGGTDRLCEAFAKAAIQAYFAAETGSPISGLMRGMRVGSNAVAREASADEEHLDIGATGLVIRGNELYIAQLLPSQVYIFRDDELNALPAESVGHTPEPEGIPFNKDIELFRATLESADTIAVTSSVIARAVRHREIRGLIARYDSISCANQLGALALQRGIVEGDILLLRLDPSIKSPTINEPRMAQSEFTVTDPAQSDLSPSSKTDSQQDRGSNQSNPLLKATVTAHDVPYRSLGRNLLDMIVSLPLLLVLLPTMAIRGAVRSLRAKTSRSEINSPGMETAQSETEYERRRAAIASGPTDLDDLNRQILTPAGDAIPSSWPHAPTRQNSGLFGGIWRAPRGGQDHLVRNRRHRPSIGPGSLILLFSIVVVLVMLIVLFVRREEDPLEQATKSPSRGATPELITSKTAPTDQANAADYFARAKSFFDAALKEENDAPALAALQDAADAANRAGSLGYTISEVNRLLARIDDERDLRNKVTRVATSATIAEFGVTGAGHSLEQLEIYQDRTYVIDAINGQIMEFTAPKRGKTILRIGEQIGQVGVADIIAVIARDLSLLVIDSNFNVFSIVPDQKPQQLRILGTNQWKEPIAFDNFQNNLYVLDRIANRIHKYIPTPGGYEVEPSDFFDPAEQVDVSMARDMAIDGDIYVLLDDNNILKYRAGQQMRFQIRGLDRPIQSASLIFTDRASDSLFVVDEGNRRIIEVDIRDGNEGMFLRQFLFRGADDFFSDIRGIWVRQEDGRLLVLGANSLRQFVLPKLPDQ